MQNSKNVKVTSLSSINLSKSSRLKAIRQKAGQATTETEAVLHNRPQPYEAGLKPEQYKALEQANKLIDEKLNAIINVYPTNKKNKFFKIKYGVELTQVKTLALLPLFNLLKLDTAKVKDFRLIEQLDCQGHVAEDNVGH